ncbi:MAG: DUF2608 domain-containing protein [Rickettsiaceae bacterium]
MLISSISYSKEHVDLDVSTINDSQIAVISEYFDHATLIFVNLDECLTTPMANMFRYTNNNLDNTLIDNLISASKTNPVWRNTVIQWLQNRKIMLSEESWIDFINDAHKAGVTIIGIYYIDEDIGRLITDLGNWKVGELQALGVEFTKNIKGQNYIEIGKNNSSAFFYDGILFNGNLTKTDAVVKFLKTTGMMPDRILFFDYKTDDINYMSEYSEYFNLDFYGIKYRGAFKLEGFADPEIVQFQKEQLIQNDKWFEDEEAYELLNQRRN